MLTENSAFLWFILCNSEEDHSSDFCSLWKFIEVLFQDWNARFGKNNKHEPSVCRFGMATFYVTFLRCFSGTCLLLGREHLGVLCHNKEEIKCRNLGSDIAE